MEEVLLPTLEEISRRFGDESAAWAFAAHWGADWLRRARHLSPPPARPLSLLIGDASRDELDPDAPYIRALELFCARAGLDVLSLSTRGVMGIGDAVSVRPPKLVVVAGSHLSDDSVARWAYAIRSAAGPVPVVVFRRGTQQPRISAPGARILPSGAAAAHRRVIELVDPETRSSLLGGGGPGLPAVRESRQASGL